MRGCGILDPEPMDGLIAAAAMLPCPLPVAIDIELHEKEVIATEIGLTIDGPFSVADHICIPIGLAHVHHSTVVVC